MNLPALLPIAICTAVLALIGWVQLRRWMKSRRAEVRGPHVVAFSYKSYDVRWQRWNLECKYCGESKWGGDKGDFSDTCEGFC